MMPSRSKPKPKPRRRPVVCSPELPPDAYMIINGHRVPIRGRQLAHAARIAGVTVERVTPQEHQP